MTVSPFGPNTAFLAVVGDGPGEDETHPLSGTSGQYIRGLLKDLGVEPLSVLWANVYDEREEVTEKRTAELGTRMLGLLHDMPNLKTVLVLGDVAKAALSKSTLDAEIIEVQHPAEFITSGETPPAFIEKVTRAAEIVTVEKGEMEDDPAFESHLREATLGGELDND